MRRTAAAVGLVVLGLTLLSMRGALGGGQDEELAFLTTASLVRDHDHAFGPDELAEVRARVSQWTEAVREARNGRSYSVFGPAQSLLAIPLYVAADFLARGAAPESRRATCVRWCCALNPLLTALTAALVCGWLLALGLPRGAAVAGGLGYALATPAWPYAKTFLAEPLSACAFLAAMLLAWACALGEDHPLAPSLARRGPGGAAESDSPPCQGGVGGGPQATATPTPAFVALLAGLAFALAVLARPHNVVLLACPAWLAARGGRRALALFLAPPLAVCGWWCWFNTVRFGRPLDFGYLAAIQGDFHLTALPVGVVGQLLSPGRGLVWYAPGLLLAVWGWPVLARRDRGLAWALGLACLAPLLFYSLRSAWWGNWCWGPRYLIPVVPLLALPAGVGLTRAPRAVAVALGGLGLLGALAGLVTYNGLYQDFIQRRDGGFGRLLWDPLSSPLVGHWRMLARHAPDVQLWQLARLDPAFALVQAVLRLVPAALGLLWLRRGDDGGR